uniref:30S ribosomal protein S16, chloroplastic n=2 Tax=Cephalotaxus harringtonia TaxID=58029 RepID=G4LAL2_CEPHW|nr:ribosomal protein S16 [Cephalotaxus harringtonia var. wilsoniana]YP_010138152.1 ribosomal protein S16 [Cephalotaxus harringtonia]UPV70589.1 ribosomal protein S16 [Cephalotaxus harringtonia var. nana]QPO89928.1 ribosomal protein S16 [Cephalotaxus harringtonia]UPV70671.1 ribosomal protein S16 [Cephalotaxus harringtonia var. nana]UPV71901.1 ribosomal protein S16 [Cephalotaxus harringtonia var. wilsoniana]UPV72311.1 ribosomal protein S16 [Cephalotaxus harringtonia var. wilsoniana]
MIRIRLKRCGRKQQTRLIYGAIVNFLEFELGAQPIETVHGIFLKAKIYRFKRALELKKRGDKSCIYI